MATSFDSSTEWSSLTAHSSANYANSGFGSTVQHQSKMNSKLIHDILKTQFPLFPTKAPHPNIKLLLTQVNVKPWKAQR
jgi:hypothetical protein